MPAVGEVNPLPEQGFGELVSKPAKSGGFSLPSSLNDLKGIVDRMGGIDGIVSTMTKVQKVVASVTQMAPLIKVLAGSFKKDSAATASDDGDGLAVPRRRKRRRTGSTGGGRKRRTGSKARTKRR